MGKTRLTFRNYTNYISGITFRFIKPHTPCLPTGYINLTPWIRFANSLESANTRIPYREGETKRNLRKICNIPRMSTLAIGAIISEGVSRMKDTLAFVNVGVWHGFTLLSAIVGNPQKRCIGVDNFSEFGSPRKAFFKRFNRHKRAHHSFYEMDCLDYFSKVHKGLIGFYVYDGNHNYKNQLRGLEVAEPFFSENCIILVDDANYDGVRKVTTEFVSSSPYRYRTLLHRTTYCNYHPTFWNGIIVLQRVR